MTAIQEKTLSLQQATRLLCRTRNPSDEQKKRVARLMEKGILPACKTDPDPEKWTTTNSAIADFLARRQVQKKNVIRKPDTPDADPGETSDAHWEENSELKSVYQGMWKDYFLAVMMRRRTSHRSKAFRRATLIGQVVVLLVLVGVLTGVVQSITRLTTKPAEQLAVAQWIKENTDAFALEKWHPAEPNPHGAGLIVRAEYRYRKESQRWIHTKRVFLVQGESVSEMSEE